MKIIRSAVKGAAKLAQHYPRTAAATGGYAAGATAVTAHNLPHTHPEFYDQTPNKGRSEDRHPSAGSYYG